MENGQAACNIHAHWGYPQIIHSQPSFKTSFWEAASLLRMLCFWKCVFMYMSLMLNVYQESFILFPLSINLPPKLLPAYINAFHKQHMLCCVGHPIIWGYIVSGQMEISGLFPMMETLYDNGKLAHTAGKSKVKPAAAEKKGFSCHTVGASYKKRQEKWSQCFED